MQGCTALLTVGRQGAFGIPSGSSGSGDETSRQGLFQQGLDLACFPGQATGRQFLDEAASIVIEALPLTAGCKQAQPLLEMRHSERDLPGQDAHPPGLDQQDGRARAIAGDGPTRQFFKGLGGAGVVTAGHEFIRPPQSGRNILHAGIAKGSNQTTSSEHRISSYLDQEINHQATKTQTIGRVFPGFFCADVILKSNSVVFG
jgi:hypothetical protein